MEFIAIVEAGAATGKGLQLVFCAGARAGWPATLPHGECPRLALHQCPVNIDADSPQVELLVHVVAGPWNSIVVVAQLAMNRDPVAEAIGVYDGFPHRRGGGGDLDRGANSTHRETQP